MCFFDVLEYSEYIGIEIKKKKFLWKQEHSFLYEEKNYKNLKEKKT